MLTVHHIYTTAPTDFKAYLQHIKKGGKHRYDNPCAYHLFIRKCIEWPY